jgi:hypothetical protein
MPSRRSDRTRKNIAQSVSIKTRKTIAAIIDKNERVFGVILKTIKGRVIRKLILSQALTIPFTSASP